MKILLINVSIRPDSKIKMFPVGLGYIATALKRSGYNFDLIDIDAYRYSDNEFDKLLKQENYDVVCFGCIVTGYKIAKELSARVRRFHSKARIVVGNTVASSVPEILLSNTEVDIAIMGEGDFTIVELLHTIEKGESLRDVKGIVYLEGGRIIETDKREVARSLDNLPGIDYDIFDVELYISSFKEQVPEVFPIPREEVRGLPINSARGCIGKCTFCYHAFQKDIYRRRSSESILAEVKEITRKYNINMVGLSDELTFFKKEQVREFSQRILDSDMEFFWGCQCRAGLFDSEDDLGIMALMKKAGCVGAFFSLESADEKILAAMNKKISVEDFSIQAKLFQKAGLPVNTSLVFGYPQETPETIKKTFDVCIDNHIYPSSGFLLPQPGSVMYDYAKKHGYITDEEEYLMGLGDRQDLYLNMTTMSDEEFTQCVQEGAKRCSDALELGLGEESLLKTGYYRGKKPQ